MQSSAAICIGDSQARRLSLAWQHTVDEKLTISGAVTNTIKRQIRKHLTSQPQSVVLWVGINDILQNIHLDMIKHNCKVIFKLLTLKKKNIFVVNLPLVLNNDCHNLKVRLLNNYFKQIELSGKICILDLNHLISSSKNPNIFYCHRFYNGKRDNVHLSRFGFTQVVKMAEQVV